MVLQSRNQLITGRWYVLPLLWLQIATSCFVIIEPAPTDLIGILLFVLLFSVGLKVPANIRTGVLLFGIFIAANIVASLISPDPVVTYRSLMVRVLMLVSWFMFVCLIYENPKAVLNTIWKGYIVAAVISVFVGVAGFYELLPFLTQYVEFGRVRAFFKDPNVYGPFIVPVALYAFSRMETSNGYRIVLYGSLFLFILYGILLGFSRGSWINFVIASLLYTGLRFMTSKTAAQTNRLLAIVGFMLFLLVVFVVFVAATDKIREMLEIRFQVQYYDTMHGGRLSNQLLILNEALTHPLGVGASLGGEMFFRAPHNIYLHVLIESGWIGAIAYYLFLGVTIQKGFKFCLQPTVIQSSYIVVFACTIGLLVQSIFIDSTHWRHMYLLFAMLWGPALFWQDEVKAARRLQDQRAVYSNISAV